MKDNHTPELCRHHHPRYYYGDAEMITVPHPARVAGKIIASYMEPDNARLFSGAWNSYHKNCGDRAVECAEGDLLGECLGAMQEFVDRVERGEVRSRYTYNKYKAILVKAKGEL